MPRRRISFSAHGLLLPFALLFFVSPLSAAKPPQGSAELDAPIAAELEGAEDLKAPLAPLVMAALDKSPASPALDDIDRLLLAARTVEVAADTSSAAAAANRAYARSDAAYSRTYSSMANAGASNGQAMYAASQAAGIAAYGAYLEAYIAQKQAEARARAQRKAVIRFRCYYKQGNWLGAIVQAMGQTGSLPGGDVLLYARAWRRAFAAGTLPSLKGDPRKIALDAYWNGLMSIEYTAMPPSKQVALFWEIQEFFDEVATGADLPEMAKTNLGASLAFFRANVTKMMMADGEKVAMRIAKIGVLSGDTKLYDDAIYSLQHRFEENPKPPIQFHETDEAFLMAGFYPEAAGNPGEALEVWRNYLDTAAYSPAYRASALYLRLAERKAAELPAAGAPPHVNHRWGINPRDVQKKSEEEQKDKTRKEKGLEWEP